MKSEKSPRLPGGESVAQAKPLLYSTEVARRLLGGMGRTWIYAQIKAGKLRTVKLGTRTLIPYDDIKGLVASALEGAA